MNHVDGSSAQSPRSGGRRETREVIVARTSLRSAPEPDALANALFLGDHETTGPLPLGFEYDLFGVSYTHFDLSTDGFIRFGTGSIHGHHYVTLGGSDARPLGAGLLAFEVRGAAPRRRLVVSFATVPRSSEMVNRCPVFQIILHERTGMIEMYGADAR